MSKWFLVGSEVTDFKTYAFHVEADSAEEAKAIIRDEPEGLVEEMHDREVHVWATPIQEVDVKDNPRIERVRKKDIDD
jgi:hypothetical protein